MVFIPLYTGNCYDKARTDFVVRDSLTTICIQKTFLDFIEIANLKRMLENIEDMYCDVRKRFTITRKPRRNVSSVLYA